MSEQSTTFTGVLGDTEDSTLIIVENSPTSSGAIRLFRKGSTPMDLWVDQLEQVIKEYKQWSKKNEY